MGLCRTAGDAEALCGYDDIGRVCRAGDLSAIGAVAKSLEIVSLSLYFVGLEHTFATGSPVYSSFTFSQKQDPVGMVGML